jgi:hypothetical protein
VTARLASALAAVRRSDPAPDLPASKRWTTAADPESALLTLAEQAYADAEDFACEAYGERVWKVQPKKRGQR